ncbi:MAG: hypothetical protein FWH56_01310 [Betaproteobacteria bacterium]|nr:hypothetical protein [Betaproteobacteria bacterium]
MFGRNETSVAKSKRKVLDYTGSALALIIVSYFILNISIGQDGLAWVVFSILLPFVVIPVSIVYAFIGSCYGIGFLWIAKGDKFTTKFWVFILILVDILIILGALFIIFSVLGLVAELAFLLR